MKNTIEGDLILKTATLQRSAPREFDEWVGALMAYATEAARKCMQAPPDHIHRLQGRAQQCDELAALFAGSGRSADRIEKVKSRRDFGAAV